MNGRDPAREILYAELYEEGARTLIDAMIEEREAKLDARLLLEYVMGTTLHTLLFDSELAVPEEHAVLYRTLIEKRSSRLPLSYITGQR